MKNMKSELKKIAENWNASGEFDETEFAGRFFVSDYELSEFAENHGFVWEDEEVNVVIDCRAYPTMYTDEEKVEQACGCRLKYQCTETHFSNETVLRSDENGNPVKCPRIETWPHHFFGGGVYEVIFDCNSI